MKISVFELRLKVYTLVDINLEEVLLAEAEYIDSAFALDDEWLRFHENNEYKNYTYSSEKSQFLAYNWKYHIILCFRNTSKLLDTISKPAAKKPSGANGIQCLQRLITAFIGIFLRLKPYKYSHNTEAVTILGRRNQKKYSDHNKDHSCRCHSNKRTHIRMCHKHHSNCYSQNDHGCTQVICKYISRKRKSCPRKSQDHTAL